MLDKAKDCKINQVEVGLECERAQQQNCRISLWMTYWDARPCLMTVNVRIIEKWNVFNATFHRLNVSGFIAPSHRLSTRRALSRQDRWNDLRDHQFFRDIIHDAWIIPIRLNLNKSASFTKLLGVCTKCQPVPSSTPSQHPNPKTQNPDPRSQIPDTQIKIGRIYFKNISKTSSITSAVSADNTAMWQLLDRFAFFHWIKQMVWRRISDCFRACQSS